MSYILDALKKMERQRRLDSQMESLLDNISLEPLEEKAGGRTPSRLIVAASIFFGVSGLLAGLIFYHGNKVPVSDRVATAKPKPPLQQQPAKPAPVQKDAVSSEGTGSLSPVGRVTPAEIKPRPEPEEAVKEQGEQTAIKPEFEQEKAVKEPDEPAEVKPRLELEKTVRELGKPFDLTGTYKLTSTGEMNNRKYATIERQDYHIGDLFKDMIITDIRNDRVFLKGKKPGQHYVIVFRY